MREDAVREPTRFPDRSKASSASINSSLERITGSHLVPGMSVISTGALAMGAGRGRRWALCSSRSRPRSSSFRLAFLLAMLVLSQVTVLANRLTTVIQELAIERARETLPTKHRSAGEVPPAAQA